MKSDIAEIVIGGIYTTTEDPNTYVVITKEENHHVVVDLYSDVHIYHRRDLNISELCPIPITENLLKTLHFKECDGHLFGLPDEHYYELETGTVKVQMKKEDGTWCYIQPSPDAYHGCRFVSMPYLHQLQVLLAPFAPIGIESLIQYDFKKKIKI